MAVMTTDSANKGFQCWQCYQKKPIVRPTPDGKMLCLDCKPDPLELVRLLPPEPAPEK